MRFAQEMTLLRVLGAELANLDLHSKKVRVRKLKYERKRRFGGTIRKIRPEEIS